MEVGEGVVPERTWQNLQGVLELRDSKQKAWRAAWLCISGHMAHRWLWDWHPEQKPAPTLLSCSRARETQHLSDRALRSAPEGGWANGRRFWKVLFWKGW